MLTEYSVMLHLSQKFIASKALHLTYPYTQRSLTHNELSARGPSLNDVDVEEQYSL